MGDRSPPKKPDEQYPLLKVEGGGDMSHTTLTHAVVTPDWGVACKKNSRLSRWPEFISAVWMTLILCGISFLIFHVLGMGFNRRQQLIIVKCNDSKLANNVYYHQIVPRGSQIPFVLYTEYLANMASKYPLLQFNVIFLVDDIFPDAVRSVKRNPAIYHSWFYNDKLDDVGKDAYNEFKRRYQNVNVTIISLTKFMAKTPLKYKWRLMPQEHLTFYARVFSVWQNGGVGMDLKTFNNDYHNRLLTDRRIDAILNQHNDGIDTAAYTTVLNKIDQDEATAIFSMLSSMISHIMNHTRSFFNKTLPPFPSISYEKPTLVRSHKSKREANDQSESVITDVSNDPKDFYNIDNTLTLSTSNFTNQMNESIEGPMISITEPEKLNTTDLHMSKVNDSEVHEVILFYDFSLINGPLNALSFSPIIKNKPPPVTKTVPHLLSIDTDGIFIAASSKNHPFLGLLTSAGCFGMHPKFVIHDALVTQCSGAFKEDVYCNNIYIL